MSIWPISLTFLGLSFVLCGFYQYWFRRYGRWGNQQTADFIFMLGPLCSLMGLMVLFGDSVSQASAELRWLWRLTLLLSTVVILCLNRRLEKTPTPILQNSEFKDKTQMRASITFLNIKFSVK